MIKKLSIIIPAYNEERTIKKLLNLVKNADIGKINKEIIVIDNGSEDNTSKEISDLKWIKSIRLSENIGKGTAVRTGIDYATGDIIIIQDADLEYSPNDYSILIKQIIDKKAVVVYGSRILKKDNKRSGIFFYTGGVALTWITNLLYNTKLTDVSTCYKVFRADVLKNIKLKCKRFEFCFEFTAKIAKKGIKIYEIPINYYPRGREQGKKINWKDWIEAVWTLLRYRFTK